MKSYPVCLIDLSRRRTVVIGGGRVALRKVQGLLAAEASITLVSPEVIPELESVSRAGLLAWVPRAYQPGDLSGAFLVIAATDDPQVNQAIWEEAMQVGCLINVVDDPARSNFIVPALVRRGELLLAVSTGGASPALARRIRERLEGEFGAEYGDLVALLGELRPVLLAAFPAGQARLEAALRLLDSDIMAVLARAGYAQAKSYALNILEVGVVDDYNA